MGFRAKIRERLSLANLRRKSTIDTDATSTKTTPLGRTRTNSSTASILEHLRHTKSIPASLKTLFTGHSRANTETSTLGHRASTIGAASTVYGSRGSSLEAEPADPAPTPAEEKAAGAGPSFPGKEKEAGEKDQGGVLGERKARAEEPLPNVQEEEQGIVYPDSRGQFSQSPPWANHHKLTQSIDPKPIDVSERQRPVRPEIGSPVRSQPQEAHSYPPESAAGVRPMVPPRKASAATTKIAQPEERSRGLSVDKDLAPSTGFKMKMKLAWMGLKTKAKL